MTKTKLSWVFFFLFLLAYTTARAEEPGVMDYREITLDNGLKVITLEDFSSPIVIVAIRYHVGSKDENPNRQGFAHMFEHMMFRGTDKLGPTGHVDLVHRTGGFYNGQTESDLTDYFEEVPANQLELALWLESERMNFLKIDQEAFDTERKVVEEERRLGLNAPYGTLYEDALAELFKVHPYRWSPIGNIPHLRASSVPELRAWWTTHYTPSNATLIIAGAVKHEDAQNLVKRYFGWVPQYPEPPRVTVKEPLPDAPRTVTFKQDKAPVPLVAIAFHTCPANDDDRIILELLGRIMAGGDSSRVYRHIVKEKNLAAQTEYEIHSFEQDGLFHIGAALPPMSTKSDEVLAALEEEFTKIRTEPVTERELTKARNQMLCNFVKRNLYIISRADALASASVIEGNTAHVNKDLAEIRNATPDDLLRVAKRYFDPQRMFRAKVPGNFASAFSEAKSAEDDAPITAQPETAPPPPGRPGVTRPADYPTEPPFAKMLDYDPTPQFQSKTLTNGLKVVVTPNHEVPYITMLLGLRPGAYTEQKPGTASMTLKMLIKGGTAKHTAEELADDLETFAIDLDGSAEIDSSSLSGGCLTEQIERAIGLMAEAVVSPEFDAQAFEKYRKQEIAELAIQGKEPQFAVDRELRRRLFGEHPYARLATGEVKDVEALTVKDLQKWWKKYGRPDMAVLYFGGDIELEQAAKLAEAAFQPWKSRGRTPDTALPQIPKAEPMRIYLIDEPGDQAQIRIGQVGIKRDDPRYFTSEVVSSYFGEAFGARLNNTLRVKKGLTYHAFGSFRSMRFAGQFTLSAYSKLDTTPEAVKTCLDEVARLQKEPPSDTELNDTKSYIVGHFALEHEAPEQVIDELWLLDSNQLPTDYFKKEQQAVKATDSATCAALAREVVGLSKLVIAVLGPADKLKEKLEAIAPVTLVVKNKTK